MTEKLSLIINSCDKFSDIWDAHIQLLNKNWKDRQIKTYLVTDKETTKSYEGVTILSAGEGKELSDRLRYALAVIKTEYILFTLDDYFLTKKINTNSIFELVSIMDKERIDYLRLFARPTSHKKIEGYKSLYEIDLDSKHDSHYQINLYAGIWRRTFLEKCVQESLNAWQLEIAMTPFGRKYGANCVMSKGNEFPTLDVVRKGKFLHKAKRYIDRHGLYKGDREVISWKEEIKLNCMKTIKSISSQKMVDFYKRIMKKKGYHFYSDDVQEIQR